MAVNPKGAYAYQAGLFIKILETVPGIGVLFDHKPFRREITERKDLIKNDFFHFWYLTRESMVSDDSFSAGETLQTYRWLITGWHGVSMDNSSEAMMQNVIDEILGAMTTVEFDTGLTVGEQIGILNFNPDDRTAGVLCHRALLSFTVESVFQIPGAATC